MTCTREQSLAALQRANAVRIARANFKRSLKRRELDFETFIINPPEEAGTAQVGDILRSVRGIGPIKTNRALRLCRIPDHRRVADLSYTERARLLTFIRERHPKVVERG